MRLLSHYRYGPWKQLQFDPLSVCLFAWRCCCFWILQPGTLQWFDSFTVQQGVRTHTHTHKCCSRSIYRASTIHSVRSGDHGTEADKLTRLSDCGVLLVFGPAAIAFGRCVVCTSAKYEKCVGQACWMRSLKRFVYVMTAIQLYALQSSPELGPGHCVLCTLPLTMIHVARAPGECWVNKPTRDPERWAKQDSGKPIVDCLGRQDHIVHMVRCCDTHTHTHLLDYSMPCTPYSTVQCQLRMLCALGPDAAGGGGYTSPPERRTGTDRINWNIGWLWTNLS